MAEAHTAAHIIRAVVHIQAVQDLQAHPTDHLAHLTGLQVHPTDHPAHLIHVIPEAPEAEDTAEAAESAVAVADALLLFFSCFWS